MWTVHCGRSLRVWPAITERKGQHVTQPNPDPTPTPAPAPAQPPQQQPQHQQSNGPGPGAQILDALNALPEKLAGVLQERKPDPTPAPSTKDDKKDDKKVDKVDPPPQPQNKHLTGHQRFLEWFWKG